MQEWQTCLDHSIQVPASFYPSWPAAYAWPPHSFHLTFHSHSLLAMRSYTVEVCCSTCSTYMANHAAFGASHTYFFIEHNQSYIFSNINLMDPTHRSTCFVSSFAAPFEK